MSARSRLLVLAIAWMAGSAAALAQPVSFAPAANFAVGTSPRSVAIADLDADGKPDLAAASFSGNSVSVLLGTGGGTFGPATTFAAGTSPAFVAIGDLSGDGKPDLAVTNYNGGSVSVLLGNGSGGFAPAASFVVGANPRELRLRVTFSVLDQAGRALASGLEASVPVPLSAP